MSLYYQTNMVAVKINHEKSNYFQNCSITANLNWCFKNVKMRDTMLHMAVLEVSYQLTELSLW